jgi:sarcosine oxidase subunit alpha
MWTPATPRKGPSSPVWIMPQARPPRSSARCGSTSRNDVKVSDIELAAREGLPVPSNTPSATPHARHGHRPGQALEHERPRGPVGALHVPIPQVGTTTFRPPYTPLTMGTIAGVARHDLFQPCPQDAHSRLARTPRRHLGARRPLAPPLRLPAPRRGPPRLYNREILAVRNGVGLLDASTWAS